jgi:predicted house-cleaning noncanonical NTP pyrophosphatase (MazG superfamily)
MSEIMALLKISNALYSEIENQKRDKDINDFLKEAISKNKELVKINFQLQKDLLEILNFCEKENLHDIIELINNLSENLNAEIKEINNKRYDMNESYIEINDNIHKLILNEMDALTYKDINDYLLTLLLQNKRLEKENYEMSALINQISEIIKIRNLKDLSLLIDNILLKE